MTEHPGLSDDWTEEDGEVSADERYFYIDILSDEGFAEAMRRQGFTEPKRIRSALLEDTDVGAVHMYDKQGNWVFDSDGRGQPHLTHTLIDYIKMAWAETEEDWYQRRA